MTLSRRKGLPATDYTPYGEVLEKSASEVRLKIPRKQIVAASRDLIAALLHRPKVLFLDEPTIGLDVVSQKKVREFLREYTARNRITTLLTSHYMQDIEELCERVIIIDHGQVFFDGALQDIIDRLATHKMMTLVRRKGFAQTDFTAYGEVLERNDNEVKLKIPREKIVAASQDLIAALKVDDFTVEDVPIEDIIREVFTERQDEMRGTDKAPSAA